MKTHILVKLIAIFVMSTIFQNCTKDESLKIDESNKGYLQFYQPTDLGLGPLSVYINGNYEGSFSNVDPDGPNSSTCEIEGFSKKLDAGTYSWRVTNSSGTVSWANTSNVQKFGICTSVKLIRNISTNGNLIVWIQSDIFHGEITVSVSGISKDVTLYYSSAPNCGANGCANFTLPQGNYYVSAKAEDGKTWSGNLQVNNGECSRLRLF